MKPRPRSLLPAAALLLTSMAWAHATEEFRLFANDGAAGDQLGASVDVDDATIVAGAPGADPSGSGSGAAYVFFYDGATYAQEAKLVAGDGAAQDNFGAAVSIDGDTAVVGAPGSDTGGANAGAAYVFLRTGTTWTQQAKLTPSNPAAQDGFGRAVSVWGNTLLVGAPRTTASGSAYVFTRTGTVWNQQAELSATDGGLGNRFGGCVSLKDDLAAVGASLQSGAAALSGAAYVFRRTGSVWGQEQKLQAAVGVVEDGFGTSCAVSAEGIIEVGAPGDDENGSSAGALYNFSESGGVWSQQFKRLGLAAGDTMGVSTDITYNFSITGSHLLDGGAQNSGSGVLWFANSAVLAQVYSASEAGENMQLGKAVACDLCWMVCGGQGDGFKGFEAGAVYVFETLRGSGILSNGTFVNPIAMQTLEGPNIGQPWIVEFDTSSHPGTTITDILIYRNLLATPVNTRWGEALLSFAGPRLLWSTVLGSGTVQHSNGLPFDPSFISLSAAAQGMLRDANGILTLTNAELITIGCYGQ